MNRKINIQLNDIANKSKKFEGLREFVEFLKSEGEFWRQKRESLDKNQSQIHSAFGVHSNFEQALKTIQTWDHQLEGWDESDFNQQVQTLHQNLQRQLSHSWLWSGHSFVEPFFQCQKQHSQDAATSFLAYVSKNQVSSLNSYQSFLGVLLGYEFENQNSDIPKRRNGEKFSLGHLRSQLEETTETLIGEVEEFKKEFNEWESETHQNWSNWLKNSDEEHKEQQNSHRDDFVAYMEDCKVRIADLENTYQEKLRLEKPAEYWKTAARKFGVQGGLWSLALLTALLLGVVYFYAFFKDWLEGKQLDIQLSTVQGVIIFGTILAVYAFMVKVLSRLTFSSFHLMRDAEEREQLTYLYLSLVNEKKIDEASRDIVLQALFSRAETGLLVAESGPTMPGAGEVLKAAAKL
ncbi:DUF6161 domain-containing protein [Teredinibacter turnerae]|uniref:DUF6161 domain-containing protein n=1 Tax=Teredinibacter turnerae TaxID=2426 RepID=UPI000374E950|nr:DUF6161 domain-containing protein [Teredinibacter turnerae]